MHTIKIGELAREADVHIETLRFYERKGLLSAAKRTEKGYRLYERDDITRVRFIKHAQRVGFSLKEVLELLQLKLDRFRCHFLIGTRDKLQLRKLKRRVRNAKSTG